MLVFKNLFTVRLLWRPHSLCNLIYCLIATRTLKERLLLQYRVTSLELTSTRKEGIRYVFCLPQDDAPVFFQQLTAYLPDVTVTEVPDLLETLQDSPQLYVKEFKQARHFAYPLAANETLAQHDPIAYITGAMTRPAEGEQIVYQLVLSATHPRSVTRIRNKLALGQDPNLYSAALPIPFRILFWLIRLPFAINGAPMTATFSYDGTKPFKDYEQYMCAA